MEQIILVRQSISSFQTGYNLLIGFIVLLILGIILTNRNLRSSTRGLGIILLILGVLFYGGIFLAGYLIPAQLPLEMIPSSLQSLVLQLAEYILSPLKFFSLSRLIGGILLFTVSFFFGSHGVKEDD